MHAELLYTSAAAGLKKGSRGFCTVIATEGMPVNLSQRLESLSGYRHLYQPGDDRADENPVCYSHLRFSLGGRFVHVVSRISAYGVDYSQRTNKLAHHVVVDPLPACGPASLLQSELMRTEWDGVCRTIPTGPVLPPLAVEAEVCHKWKAITGDAGWGGVLTGVWMEPVAKPLWIIYDASQSASILPLIAESISLLPDSKRWNASFSTYCASLPPDIECRVRCVVAGSEEARMAAARGTVINLTAIVGPPAPSKWVEAARTGVVPKGAFPSGLSADSPTASGNIDFFDLPTNELHHPPSRRDDEYRLRGEPPQSTPPTVKNKSKEQRSPTPVIRNKYILSSIGLLLAMIAIAIGVGIKTITENINDGQVPENLNPPTAAHLDHNSLDEDEKKDVTVASANGSHKDGTEHQFESKSPEAESGNHAVDPKDAASATVMRETPTARILANYIDGSTKIEGIDGMLFSGQDLHIDIPHDSSSNFAGRNWTIMGNDTSKSITGPIEIDSVHEGKIINVGITGASIHGFKETKTLIVPSVTFHLHFATFPPEESIDKIKTTLHYNSKPEENIYISLGGFQLLNREENYVFIDNVLSRQGDLYKNLDKSYTAIVSKWRSIKHNQDELRKLLENRGYPGKELWLYFDSVPKQTCEDIEGSIKSLEQFVVICDEFLKNERNPSQFEQLRKSWAEAKQKIVLKTEKPTHTVQTSEPSINNANKLESDFINEIKKFRAQFIDIGDPNLTTSLDAIRVSITEYKKLVHLFIEQTEQIRHSDKNVSFRFKETTFSSSTKLPLSFKTESPSQKP